MRAHVFYCLTLSLSAAILRKQMLNTSKSWAFKK